VTSSRKNFAGVALALATIGGAAGVATEAQAQGPLVACNAWHECWHIRSNHWAYPAREGITIHSEHWVHAQGWPVSWRADHYERGYWHSGVWVRF
jgi:hypothetical protein